MARLNELDPFVDKEISCSEMKKHPELIFTDSIDLGSGSMSPTEVDYRCPASLSQQKYMQRLLALAERIRNERAPRLCTGSIIYAEWRYFNFRLAEAGFAPGLLLKNQRATQRSQEVFRYFKQWSEGSLYNHALYTKFTSESERIQPILANHYAANFGLSRNDAQRAARHAQLLVLQRAAGGFPRSDLKQISVLVQLVRNSKTKPDALRAALAKDRYSDGEILDALRVALINNRPLALVSILTDALDTAALQSAEGDSEPLLSIALGSEENFEYLLSKKVPVDAANSFGKTTLFYAVGANKLQAVQALIKAGADVNHATRSAQELRPDNDECIYPNLSHTRRTPVMHAAQHSDIGMIKVLLEAGARMESADDLGYNALDYSSMGAKPDNGTYLKSLGLKTAKAPKE